jgi:O-antigen ligase
VKFPFVNYSFILKPGLSPKVPVLLFLFISPVIFITALFDPAVLPRFIFSFVIVLLAFCRTFMTKKWGIFQYHPVIFLWLLFIAYSSLSLFQSRDFPAAMLTLGKYVLVLLLVMLLRFRLETDSGFLRSIARLTAIVVLFECVIAVAQRFFHAPLFGYGVAPVFLGTLTHKNELSLFFLYTFPLVGFHAITSRGWERYASAVALFGAVFFIAIVKTRAVWLAGVVNMAVFIIAFYSEKKIAFKFLKPEKKIRKLVPIIAALLLASIAVITWAERNELSKKMSVDISASVRLKMWRETIPLILKNPLFGIGADNWKFTNLADEGNWMNERPHNDFLWIAAEHGIPALAIYLAIFILSFGMGVRLLSQGSLNERLKAWLFFSGLISYSIFAFFNFPKERIEHQVYFALFQAGILFFYGKQTPKSSMGKHSKQESFFLHAAAAGAIVFFLFWGIARLANEIRYKKIYCSAAALPEKRIDLLQHIDQTYYKVNPFATPVDYDIGMAYLALKQYPETVRYLEMARSVNKTQLAILSNLALAYVFMGNREKALPLFAEACDLYPFHQASKLNCALIYYQKKDIQNCKKYFSMIDKKSIQSDSSLLPRYRLLEQALLIVQ